jgi:predicted site-specific integrase-resolvase
MISTEQPRRTSLEIQAPRLTKCYTQNSEGFATIIYGYARVSTDGQTLDAQHAKLTAEGAEKIFSEKESGAKTDRKALAKALAALEQGDMFIVRG